MRSKIEIPPINSFYRLGLLLLIIKVLLSMSEVVPEVDLIDDILSLSAAICLGISIIKKVYPVKVLFAFAAVMIFACITTVQTGAMAMLLTVLACISLYGEDLEETIHFIYTYELIVFILNITLAVLMMLFGYTMQTQVGDEMNYNFGFTHPNVFAVLLVNISCMWTWLNYDRLKLKDGILMLIMHILFFLATGSRTAVLAMFGMWMLILIFRGREKIGFLLNIFTASATPILSVMVFWAIKNYEHQGSLVMLLDKIFNARVRLGSYAYAHYGISLFGQDMRSIEVKWDPVWRLNAHTFDNIYSFLMVNIGTIWLVIIAVVFLFVGLRGKERSNIAILVWCFYGMTEVHGWNPFMLFPLLLVAEIFVPRKNKSLTDSKSLAAQR